MGVGGGDVELGEVGRHVVAAGNGDAAAWEWIVRRFSGLLWSVTRGLGLRTEDAADVVQTTWLRLLDNLGRVRDPDAVGAWLATTARYESFRTLRKTGRTVPTTLEDGQLPNAPGDDDEELDDRLRAEELSDPLWRAFEQLSPRCRSLLRFLMADPPPTYHEAAAALDMPIGSIGPIRRRCLDRLRDDPELAGYQVPG